LPPLSVSGKQANGLKLKGKDRLAVDTTDKSTNEPKNKALNFFVKDIQIISP
jgi:hypothetical protein